MERTPRRRNDEKVRFEIERISASLEEAAQNLGASGEHVTRDAKRRPVKLASSGLRSVHAGANGCASIDGYEVA